MKMQAAAKSALFMCIVAMVIVGLCACGRGAAARETLHIAYAPFEPTALLWIAEDQGLFAKHGLATAMHSYHAGAVAMEAMLKGEAEVAVGVSEFPQVRKALQQQQVRVVGSIDKTELIYVLARRDRGIGQPSDLKGKRVGTALKSVSEFYLGTFLNLNGLTMQDIQLVDLKTPAEWVGAIAAGDIDAIAIAQPYAKAIQDQLGEKVAVWPAQGGQALYGLIVVSGPWLDRHPETVRKLLGAFVEAEDYLAGHPAEAKAIVRKRLNLDAAYLDAAWPHNQFALSLGQDLLVTMEDQARWMIKNKLTERKEVPNFLDYLHLEALHKVRPGAVTVIH